MPNFDRVSQSTAEIKLLPVLENGRPPYWNFISGSVSTYAWSSACHLHLPAKFRSIRTDDRRRSYDVISIFKMAATESEIYFRVGV